MARHLRPCLALVAVLALAGGCKVSASSSTGSANDAKPDGSGSAKPDGGGEHGKPVGDGSGGGDEGDGGDGGTTTLKPVPARPVGQDAGNGNDNLSAGNACADAGHKPGDSWKDDCNTCNCTDAGEVVCTRMHCGDKSAPH